MHSLVSFQVALCLWDAATIPSEAQKTRLHLKLFQVKTMNILFKVRFQCVKIKYPESGHGSSNATPCQQATRRLSSSALCHFLPSPRSGNRALFSVQIQMSLFLGRHHPSPVLDTEVSHFSVGFVTLLNCCGTGWLNWPSLQPGRWEGSTVCIWQSREDAQTALSEI